MTTKSLPLSTLPTSTSTSSSRAKRTTTFVLVFGVAAAVWMMCWFQGEQESAFSVLKIKSKNVYRNKNNSNNDNTTVDSGVVKVDDFDDDMQNVTFQGKDDKDWDSIIPAVRDNSTSVPEEPASEEVSVSLLPPPFEPPSSIAELPEEVTKYLPYRCEWTADNTWKDSCLPVARSYLAADPLYKPNAKHSSLFVFGDSTVRGIAEAIQPRKKGPFRKVDAQHRCQSLAFYGLTKSEVWIPPTSTQGPVKFGSTHPYCHDMRGFPFRLTSSNLTVHYQAVEFAQDVSLQTPKTNTTQETVALYIQKQQQQQQQQVHCLASTGMHDLMIPNMTTAIFIEHLEWYLGILQGVCTRILWLLLTASLDDPEFPQRNDWVYEMNVEIQRTIARLNQQRPDSPIMVVDFWDKSLHTEHSDNIHLYKPYRTEAANWILGLYQKDEQDDESVQ